MDKATIVKDTIDYIQLLRDQERTIQAELIELESWKLEIQNLDLSPTKKRVDMRGSSILIMEVSNEFCYENNTDLKMQSLLKKLAVAGAFVGDKIMVVNLKCSKRRDTIVRLCEVLVSEAQYDCLFLDFKTWCGLQINLTEK
ncbi:hypothetical protein HanXRQr2_Chr17g0792711 [Helianthus annuus]|uniref:Myc-type, basic helix-loop-helix (BHLH) domain-containing protein n=1 Tax=Helianthus annuus TaxID=4232 RepID=A0A9K3DHT2_HELAN|nr:transcription factor bHLH27-like [Helianthus annuus]KAF5754568.1 hypothetical protein HanXRQr2_Chr17g0792711 [Helianthus annuus]KAJ0428436.1 putative transcription factor bHLH family [Helianthus annuus]KAJ0432526.1 putative transcription factor bHLH family [Helianthus annuus]KAJ0812321.1 putative transcription factor bHLH family [Helianthus annuus]